jgi:hypothetical protein
MSATDGPVSRYAEIMSSLDSQARNAIRRGKPTMWAYFVETREGLRSYFAHVTPTDGGYAGAALALSQRAESRCPTLPVHEAARLWALSVYARRILASWGVGTGGRVSLQWLRDREVHQ